MHCSDLASCPTSNIPGTIHLGASHAALASRALMLHPRETADQKWAREQSRTYRAFFLGPPPSPYGDFPVQAKEELLQSPNVSYRNNFLLANT